MPAGARIHGTYAGRDHGSRDLDVCGPYDSGKGRNYPMRHAQGLLDDGCLGKYNTSVNQ